MQKGLFTEKPRLPDNLNKICCKPCYMAKTPEKECQCHCNGKYHGVEHEKPLDPNDKILLEGDALKYRAQITDPFCICGTDLSKELISYYVPHDGGYTIPREKEKAWLFVHCKKCGYDMALWKMGVAHE